ncbi:MAG: D-glucuronyl C5-epimerase family protein, partial [Flavobacteriaceae bacterium]|nr:D-glucuronyl C5-epimerase family protein [Flavobacteriaceae bacterium]
NEGIETLKKNIDVYDADFISKYSLFQRDVYWPGWAKKTYHKLHILQLLWLHDVTQEKVFYEKGKKFLEVQKTTFEKRACNIGRVVKVTANSQIAERSPSYVYDNQWSWGGIWASKSNNPELVFEMANERDIYGFSLFHNSEKSSELPLKVFVTTSNLDQYIAEDLKQLDHIIHPSGKKRVTYIDIYHFRPIKGKNLHIQFQSPEGERSVQITEVDIFSDLKTEIDCLLESVKKQRNDDIALFK